MKPFAIKAPSIKLNSIHVQPSTQPIKTTHIFSKSLKSSATTNTIPRTFSRSTLFVRSIAFTKVLRSEAQATESKQDETTESQKQNVPSTAISTERKNKIAEEAALPYFLTFGNKIGGYPRCRGCKTTLKDRNALRVEVRGAFTPLAQAEPHPVKYSLCLNTDCIRKATQKYDKQTASGIYLPPFHNQIGIPAEIKAGLNGQAPP
eukprot:CAMPEP_0168561242 /NCGR_PEP_ID=MMETSP0413-20121227/11490_1 /TAXON_ID=136452 /ORGANISM="Filamoeba nolandi, Strain NC-AS-23-1" /LENGTH=204 /DNA_ID=CAMNT_0008592599 /DNA_START=10 /DNA_END=621 /DNA_ORIENTATION=+